ncbi:complement C1q-like protein 4 [Haliotis rufescens]|uniref:complement C1q-like protein 4 n=1 Tax=Haliotis rufescens TaxID=6454 RepID=UPI001EAFF7BB|nr:complement C1q-like protein 4 [Haliotis rufescens]
MATTTTALLCLCAVTLVASIGVDITEHLNKRAGSSRVAFSAGLTTNLELHQPVNITFDRVFTNIGDAYDNNTGEFTCPAAGTYVFQFHGLTESDGSIWMELFKNNAYVISAYSHSANDYGAASNAIVLQLAVGDVVHLQGHGDVYLYGASDEVYATFNGFLLYPAKSS